MLSLEQIRFYQEQGYLIVEDLIEPKQCDLVRERISFLIDSFYKDDPISIFETDEKNHSNDNYFLDSGDKIRFFFEKDAFSSDEIKRKPIKDRLNKVGHALHDLDPVFNQFSRQKCIEALVKDLGINNPLIVQSMFIFKQPFIGGEVNAHQDGSFLISNPDTLLGLWFALEDSTKENGCLWALPKGHVLPLKRVFVRHENAAGKMMEKDDTPWPLDKMVSLEAKKGSVIVLHSKLPHMSFANHSNQSRHAYTLHCIDKTSHFAPENWIKRHPSLPFRGFEA